jgi:hypothetical protein
MRGTSTYSVRVLTAPCILIIIFLNVDRSERLKELQHWRGISVLSIALVLGCQGNDWVTVSIWTSDAAITSLKLRESTSSNDFFLELSS